MQSDSAPTSLSASDRALAEMACERLIKQFAQCNDAWDHDGIAALFVEEGKFSRPLAPDDYVQGREAIRALFRDRPKRLARHIMSTIVIDVATATTARGRCYLQYVSNANGDTPLPALAEPGLMIGQYDDEFVLTKQGWRFKSRRGCVVLKS